MGAVSAVVLALVMLAGCSRPLPATRIPPSPTPPAAVQATHTVTGPQVEHSGTGIPNLGASLLEESTPPPEVYIVQPGDTLSGIASRFGCTLDALIEANQLRDPNALQVGQKLHIPSTQASAGPSLLLLPDSEFVNGPAYVDFDLASFCDRHGGFLTEYRENVGGQVLTGPEIVLRTVHHFSVGPRMLLALLELKSGWVTDPNPSGAARSYPMGRKGDGWDQLSRQLEWAADNLNQGYYDWRGRGMTPILWKDGTATRYAPTLNAATAGLQYLLSLNVNRSQWEMLVGEGPDGFVATYQRLFGDAAQYAVEPLVPVDIAVPQLGLPWSPGELWFYTGGPHGGWGDGSAWSALDFVPDEGYLGCQPASEFATAAAPGLVIYSQEGEVLVDLDGDGHEETGWILFYLHVASKGRVSVGTRVERGDRIGHPSCEGGFSESTHLHLARKYNGEWIAADGPLPMVLGGWQFYSSGSAYDGYAQRGGETRTACECWEETTNGLRADR